MVVHDAFLAYLYLLQGIDLDRLLEASKYISSELNRVPTSKVARALNSKL